MRNQTTRTAASALGLALLVSPGCASNQDSSISASRYSTSPEELKTRKHCLMTFEMFLLDGPYTGRTTESTFKLEHSESGYRFTHKEEKTSHQTHPRVLTTTFDDNGVVTSKTIETEQPNGTRNTVALKISDSMVTREIQSAVDYLKEADEYGRVMAEIQKGRTAIRP